MPFARADGLVAVRLQQVVEELHVELVVLTIITVFDIPRPSDSPAPEPTPPGDRGPHASARMPAQC